MKIFNIVLSADTDGVEEISFVENPAIEVDFIALSKSPAQEEKSLIMLSEDKQIVTTPVLIPDKLIFRSDANRGDHYIQFSKETIEQISQKYFKDGKMFKFNLEHSQPVKGVYLCESYLVNSERNIEPPKEFSDLPDGTWIASFKVENTNLWKAIKLGQFKGVSIEGYFDYENEELSELKAIYKELSKLN